MRNLKNIITLNENEENFWNIIIGYVAQDSLKLTVLSPRPRIICTCHQAQLKISVYNGTLATLVSHEHTPHLHATHTHTNDCRSALLTFSDLVGCFLLGSVVPVLTGAHLQVQDTRHLVAGSQILQ